MIELADCFYKLIDNLISLNQKRRRALDPSVKESMTPAQYAISFATVKCDIGRMVGKTEYVKRRAAQGALVVVPTKREAKVVYGDTGCDVLSAKQVRHLAKNKTLTYSMIFIEEPTYTFAAVPVRNLYEILVVEGMDQTFVQLGE